VDEPFRPSVTTLLRVVPPPAPSSLPHLQNAFPIFPHCSFDHPSPESSDAFSPASPPPVEQLLEEKCSFLHPSLFFLLRAEETFFTLSFWSGVECLWRFSQLEPWEKSHSVFFIVFGVAYFFFFSFPYESFYSYFHCPLLFPRDSVRRGPSHAPGLLDGSAKSFFPQRNKFKFFFFNLPFSPPELRTRFSLFCGLSWVIVFILESPCSPPPT